MERKITVLEFICVNVDVASYRSHESARQVQYVIGTVTHTRTHTHTHIHTGERQSIGRAKYNFPSTHP